MSGIVGILHLDGAPVDRALLERLTEFQSFRGPDARQVWLSGQIGFGHTLLKTTDESERESQPFTLDGNVWIVADARVDAQRDLRAALADKGHAPAPDAPDVELVLCAYHAWREDCVEQLLGDFAFAVWDGPRRRLFCARDQMGVKPFYYAHIGSTVIFSNTLDCIRQHPVVSNKLNDLAIADFLLFETNQDPATTSFADIQRLPPAHVAVWDTAGLHLRRYWTMPIDEPLFLKRADDYCVRFRELLRETVSDRVRTHCVGVFMSGGLDSTTLAATGHKVLSARYTRFDLHARMSVDERIPEETVRAKAVADRFGIAIHFQHDGDEPIDPRWERIPFRTEEPRCRAYNVLEDWGRWLEIASESRVFFWGEGPDNALRLEWGPYVRFLSRRRLWARLFRETFSTLTTQRRPPFWGRLSNRLASSDAISEPYAPYPDWVNSRLETRFRLRERWKKFHTYASSPHPVRPNAYASFQSPVWPILFQEFSPATTRACIEVRHPYLDLRMLRFLLSVPVLPWCRSKFLLRRAMRGILPNSVLRQRKIGGSGRQEMDLITTHGLIPFAPVEEILSYVDALRAKGKPTDDVWEVSAQLRVRSLNHWLQNSSTSVQNTTLGGAAK